MRRGMGGQAAACAWPGARAAVVAEREGSGGGQSWIRPVTLGYSGRCGNVARPGTAELSAIVVATRCTAAGWARRGEWRGLRGRENGDEIGSWPNNTPLPRRGQPPPPPLGGRASGQVEVC